MNRSPRSSLLLAVGGALFVTLARPALGHASVRMRWEASAEAGCPSAASVAEAVEERLGRPVFAEGPGPGYLVDGSIEASETGFRARLALRAPDGGSLGERVIEVEGEACGALLRTVAIVVSLLVTQHEPEVRLYEPPPPAAPPLAQTPLAPPEPVDPVVPAPSSRGELGIGVELGATVRGLALPGPAFGLRQALGLRWTSLPLEIVVEAQVVPPFRWEGEAAALDVWLWSAGASLCPRLFERESFRLITCAGGLGGQLHVEGVGLDVTRRAEGPRVDLVTRLGAAVRVAGPVWVSLVTLLDVPLIHHQLTAGPRGDERVVFEGAPISLGLAASVGVSFPER